LKQVCGGVDIAFARDRVDRLNTLATVADKGYDADLLFAAIAGKDAQIAVPPKRNHRFQRT
jgi:hypothetical protein